MPQMKRRHFLQFAGAAAASVGLSQLNVMHHVVPQGDRYARVLAQGTPRKLALLVGINNYSVSQAGWRPLQGCVNDVDMQKELLVHRFGFNSSDVLTLTDADATREGIIAAFEAHLIAQARPGDVVVFHYSGHGSRVVDPNPLAGEPLNSTFVPIDSPLPPGYETERVEVNDIMGQTLFLLMQSLQTEQVTVVLDSCHSGGGKRGVLTTRARDGADVFQNIHPSTVELETQDRLRSQLGLSPDEVAELRAQGIAKGVVISSATKDQLAVDASFSGFSAGAFTYLMTQYLWQQTADEPVEGTIANLNRITRRVAGDISNILQEPEFEENRPPELASAPIYFTTRQAPAAEAVVVGAEGDTLDLWLGGISPSGLETVNEAIFMAFDASGQPAGHVQVRSRDGLRATAQMIDGPRSLSPSGLFLQEQIAGVPEDLKLRIGLDPALDNRAIAEAALAEIPRLEVKTDDTDVDYLFGPMTPAYEAQQSDLVGEIPASGSLGLFLPGQDVLPNSFGAPGESIADAASRLRSKFSVLLASRLLKVLVNPGTSRLNVVASMRPVEGGNSVASAAPLTVRGQRSITDDESAAPAAIPENLPADASRLPVGTVVELEVQNNEAEDLYIGIIVIDASGGMTVLFPTNWDAPIAAALVSPGQTLKLPDPSRDNFRLRLVEPTGIVEVLVIASKFELRDALRALGDIASTRGVSRGSALSQDDTVLSVVDSLLGDLDGGTRGTRGGTRGPAAGRNFAQEYMGSNTRSIGNDSLAAFSLAFELYAPE
ncbi:MAG: caspase family protein [Elainellaceae cyanobacterium]